jgi:hypothetical protein
MEKHEKFTLYEPVKKLSENALYLQSCTGKDWYTCQRAFKKDTFKIAYGENGVIRIIDKDISKIWPINLSVVEIENISEDVTCDGTWAFDGKSIIRKGRNVQEEAENEKNSRSSKAEERIAILSRAVKLNIATAQEKRQLTAYEHYSVLLNRIDVRLAPDITWPDIPA